MLMSLKVKRPSQVSPAAIQSEASTVLTGEHRVGKDRAPTMVVYAPVDDPAIHHPVLNVANIARHGESVHPFDRSD
jgi:hypothetical protein